MAKNTVIPASGDVAKPP